MDEVINTLRGLIVEAAPDPDRAAPVRDCGPDVPLDTVIPFSSVIILGVIVAVEDFYSVRVTRDMVARAARQGTTLRALAAMVAEARAAGAIRAGEGAGA